MTLSQDATLRIPDVRVRLPGIGFDSCHCPARKSPPARTRKGSLLRLRVCIALLSPTAGYATVNLKDSEEATAPLVLDLLRETDPEQRGSHGEGVAPVLNPRLGDKPEDRSDSEGRSTPGPGLGRGPGARRSSDLGPPPHELGAQGSATTPGRGCNSRPIVRDKLVLSRLRPLSVGMAEGVSSGVSIEGLLNPRPPPPRDRGRWPQRPWGKGQASRGI
eukprot:2862546-Alexandrium_andersonii.AAC.1